MRETLLKWIRFSSFTSQVSHHWGGSDDIWVSFRSSLLRAYWSNGLSYLLAYVACVRSRVCHDREKNGVCILQLFTFFSCIVIRCLCPYLRYLLYYILDTYVCARVYISIHECTRFLYICLCTYLYTKMFALLLLLLTILVEGTHATGFHDLIR